MPRDDAGAGAGAVPASSEIEPLSIRYERQARGHATRRPAPALSTALAGLGALLAGIGVATLGGEVLVSGGSRGGAALVALVYGAGGFLLLATGQGPQRGAGAVATAVAVPLALGFVILGQGAPDPDEPTLVLALSTVAWAGLHLGGPGRGRPVFLAAALVGAWLTVVVQVGLDALFVVTPFGGRFFGAPGPPDTAVTVVLCLLFGVVYLWAGYGIQKVGLSGTATPFVGAGIVAIVVGVAVGSAGRAPWMPALLLLTTGAFVGFVGAALGRRFSTWLGTAALAAGLLVLVAEFAGDSTVAAGLALVAVGGAAAVVTPWLADALGEAPPAATGEPPPEPLTPDPPASPPAEGPPAEGPSRRQRPLRAR